MAAKDYQICCALFNAYIAKTSKQDKNRMLNDRREITDEEILTLFDWYLDKLLDGEDKGGFAFDSGLRNRMKKTETVYVKSPLNYTGGKYKLLKQILPLFPADIGRFIDLFTGGANVAVNVNAEQIIANDIEKRIIDIYKTFQTMDINAVLGNIDRIINQFSLSMENAEGYNRMRELYNKAITNDWPYKLDIALFVLICYSFNHQFRFNSKGEFNMPFGKNRSRFNDTIKENLINFHKAVNEKNIVFTNMDFMELKVDKLKQNDFVYCVGISI